MKEPSIQHPPHLVPRPAAQNSLKFRISIGLTSGLYALTEDPSIQYWTAEVEVHFGGSDAAVITTIDLCCANTFDLWEIGYELDNISADFGLIGGAIDEAAALLQGFGIGPGMTGTLVIASDVVVDKYWRGHRLGPDFLRVAADLATGGNASGIFLIPSALGTRLDSEGVCRSYYELPRGDAQAQAKVRAARKRAGFKRLGDNVLWSPAEAERSAAAFTRLKRNEHVLDTALVRAWWRRRVSRARP